MDISIGLTAQKTMEVAAQLKEAAQKALDERNDEGRPTVFDVRIDAENNTQSMGPVTISFANDDMEGRPEVADSILVDVDVD
jgi:hypothetical protein